MHDWWQHWLTIHKQKKKCSSTLHKNWPNTLSGCLFQQAHLMPLGAPSNVLTWQTWGGNRRSKILNAALATLFPCPRTRSVADLGWRQDSKSLSTAFATSSHLRLYLCSMSRQNLVCLLAGWKKPSEEVEPDVQVKCNYQQIFLYTVLSHHEWSWLPKLKDNHPFRQRKACFLSGM